MYVASSNREHQTAEQKQKQSTPAFSPPFVTKPNTEMEGQSDKDNTVELVSCDTGGTSNDYSAEIPNQKFLIAAASGRSGSQWTTCLPKPSPNYVEYLSESSTYVPNTTSEYMRGSNYLPFGSISGTDRNFFYNDPGKAFGFKPIDFSSNDLDIRKRVGFWRSDEGEEATKVETKSSQNRLYAAESNAAWTADSVGDKHSASRLGSKAVVGATASLPKPGSSCSSSKQKNEKIRVTDRQRRQRITDNLKALHELLPNPAEGSQAYILDDIIDYVKFLQLQVKELSGSRLQADSNAIPLVFHEGYGHYINEQMLNEPLEEIMGKLVEEHSAAASQLLESKGLFLLPIALVDDLNQAMQLFGGST